MERSIVATLRASVVLSVAVILFGMALTFARHPDYANSPDARRQVTGDDYRFAHDLLETMHGLVRLEGRSVITVGLLILIATPVLRVALSVVLFAVQRDRAFAVITATVLVLLLISFLLGRAG
jgi:uncharacterized membrane protein